MDKYLEVHFLQLLSSHWKTFHEKPCLSNSQIFKELQKACEYVELVCDNLPTSFSYPKMNPKDQVLLLFGKKLDKL